MGKNGKFLVLVLDDDDLFRQFVKYILEKHLDVEVVGCKTPSESFQFLEERIPDLILLDMEMPVMDGYTYLRKLRMDKRYGKIHVIPCTALSSKELFASLVKLGIDDYILKPPTDKILVTKVQKVIEYISKKDSLKISSDNQEQQDDIAE
jgi:CheY-like chemotaxis protein